PGLARELVEDVRGGCPADHDVLDPDAEAAGQVDARLDAERDAGPKRLGVAAHEIRLLVTLEADPVTRPVEELGSEPAILDDPPRGRVDRLAGGPRPDRARGADVRLPDQLVDLEVRRVRRPFLARAGDPDRPGGV